MLVHLQALGGALHPLVSGTWLLDCLELCLLHVLSVSGVDSLVLQDLSNREDFGHG